MAEIAHTIRIKAAAKDVFAAVSTDEGVKSWFTPDVEGSIESGQSATFRFADGNAFEWQFDEIEPDHQIRWKCQSGPGAAAGSSVTFDLTKASGGDTRVDLEHAGWPDDHEAFATCNTLWGILMGRLKNYAEQSGKTKTFP